MGSLKETLKHPNRIRLICNFDHTWASKNRNVERIFEYCCTFNDIISLVSKFKSE